MDDELFGCYTICYNDGRFEYLTDVAVSSLKAPTRTTFIDRNGNTVFIVPDLAIRYIKRSE